MLPRTYPVVAATPVVFAAPRPMAEALGWPDAQPSWAQLSALAADPAGWSAVKHPEWGTVRLDWPDPLTSTAGLGSTVAVYRDLAIGAEATDDLRRRLVTAHNAVKGATGNLSGALAALRATGTNVAEGLRDLPIVPATEQEVVAFNAAKPAVEVAAIYPTEGWVVSEVPVLPLLGDWVSDAQRTASEAFADFVVRGGPQDALQRAGWRAARLGASATPATGVVPTEPRYTPAQPSQDVLARTLQNWTALDRRGSLLVVLDTSGSMREEVGTTGKTRLTVAKEAVLASLPFFSDEASVGLWTFSRAAKGNDWKAVVPLGRLDRRVGSGTARDTIASAVPRIVADGDTGLHDTDAGRGGRRALDLAARAEHGRADQRRQERGPRQPRPADDPGPARRRCRPRPPGRGRDDRAGFGCRRQGAAQHRRHHQGQGLHRGAAGGPGVGVPHRADRLTHRPVLDTGSGTPDAGRVTTAPPRLLTARHWHSRRSAAGAGIVFGVLMLAAMVMLRIALDAGGLAELRTDPGRLRLVRWSLNLVPFAGIAFLWFVGVVRDQLGDVEDRLFSTVFLGSGLLFLAMFFGAAATTTSLVRISTDVDSDVVVWGYGSTSAHAFMSIYAMRMAAVFVISVSTVGIRTAALPRWTSLLGYLVALVLLVAADAQKWVQLLFPVWVLLVSVVILVTRPPARDAEPG